MSRFNQFTVPVARRMPVIILADVSGSMSVEGKIETLNRAIAETIASFAEEEDVRAEIYVAVITFGKDGAKIHQPLTAASVIQWTNMEAIGSTPMAAAFELATTVVEDKNQIASRDYYPTIVLVSDGQPTDERGHLTDNWKQPLQQLLNSPRASKALRLSMAIGADADYEVLKEFLQGQPQDIPVFRADEATQIRQFFRWVTMTVTNRSKSANPQSMPIIDYSNEDLVF
ncbi:VWA domain-containing protein [Scytonema sp. UIC 10036]|uniref:vWA domain-containing protein n=1 Tax=Scytonema sp. UIC 10036 TaxID=2304196 RepID=UPI0012DAA391|nr:VWA domain-containing protein [Scytonema sp. UIC 10036]MUG96351.1 VWA domain-containing protein [Scytonema sp. UIC 10036]